MNLIRKGVRCLIDTLHFLHQLYKEIESAPKKSAKHIIRFRAPQEYQKCISILKSKKKMWHSLSTVKNLNLIHALSCPVKSCLKILQYRSILCVEEDSKIILHPYQSHEQLDNRLKCQQKNASHIPWGVKRVKAPEAWVQSLGNRVKVGVIDTGIDYQHPDLHHAIGKGVNLLHPHLMAWDDNGHGTHIAGTIAGKGDHTGFIGVAPKAMICPIKAFNHQGNAYVSDIIRGIEWCVQNHIRIINMSFGMKSFSKSLSTAISQAYQSGTIIIASSGNDGRKFSIDFPARFPHVISVGATTRKQTVAKFTNRNKQIDVFAPGERIYSTWLHGNYHEMSGTSMATAHVSGVAALMLALRPRMSLNKVKIILKKTAMALKNAPRTIRGRGQINARRALHAIKFRNK